MKIDLGEDTGFIEVSVLCGGATIWKQLDLHKAGRALQEISLETQSKPVTDWLEKVRDLMAALGFTGVSLAMAGKFAKAILEQFEPLPMPFIPGSNVAHPEPIPAAS